LLLVCELLLAREPAVTGLRALLSALQHGLITLLHALLALQLALLGLQQALLRALRPRALRLLGLQTLDALLQTVDTGLALLHVAVERALGALVALQGAHVLAVLAEIAQVLAILLQILTTEALLLPQLAPCRSVDRLCAWRTPDGRTASGWIHTIGAASEIASGFTGRCLRRRRPLRCSPLGRGHLRRRAWREGRPLRRRSLAKCRGGARHRGWRRRSRHCGRCGRPRHGWWS
jgi:hypothetical protein